MRVLLAHVRKEEGGGQIKVGGRERNAKASCVLLLRITAAFGQLVTPHVSIMALQLLLFVPS